MVRFEKGKISETRFKMDIRVGEILKNYSKNCFLRQDIHDPNSFKDMSDANNKKKNLSVDNCVRFDSFY